VNDFGSVTCLHLQLSCVTIQHLALRLPLLYMQNTSVCAIGSSMPQLLGPNQTHQTEIFTGFIPMDG